MQQTGWADYAATIALTNSLGQQYQPTGQQVFVWWHAANAYIFGVRTLRVERPLEDGLPSTLSITVGMDYQDLILSGVPPAIDTGGRVRMSVYYPDARRVHPRTRIISTVVLNDESAADDILVPDYTVDFGPDLPLRAHYAWRYMDEWYRISTLQSDWANIFSPPPP